MKGTEEDGFRSEGTEEEVEKECKNEKKDTRKH
jgi:hypothetical protein